MIKLWEAISMLLISVLISSISQIFLKKAANKNYKNFVKEYINVTVIGAYGLFFLSMLLTMFALRYVPLSLAPIIESTSYIYVSIFGYFIFKESFTKRKILGLLLILLGIVVFSFQGIS